MPLLIFHTLQYGFIPDAVGRLETHKGVLTDSFMRCFLRLLCTGLMSLLQGPGRPVCAQFALEVLDSYLSGAACTPTLRALDCVTFLAGSGSDVLAHYHGIGQSCSGSVDGSSHACVANAVAH